MRIMVKAQIPTSVGSKGINDGQLPATIRTFMETARPESIYFGSDDGMRTMWAVIDLEDASNMPPTFEPLFMNLEARITMTPVMVPDDLTAGFEKLHAR